MSKLIDLIEQRAIKQSRFKTMSSKTSSTSSGGLSFTGALTILFIGLKLCNVISWSWWWVLSPIWISVLIGLAILSIVATIFLISELSK